VITRATVCIIDDDASVQRALRRLLQAADYDVLTCGSAEEFLALTGLPRPLCLLVDVRMRGMTGIDLQDVLHNSSRDIPIIFMSGHADAATIARATASGARFLAKPFEVDALLDALQHAFTQRRRHRDASNAQSHRYGE
jgi:FixJ family two-component response regulator